MHTDTDIFLHPLRRLSLPPPANSHAKPACSDTLPEAGYARSCNEKCPTVRVHVLLPATTFHSLQTVPQLALPYFCTRIFSCFVIE